MTSIESVYRQIVDMTRRHGIRRVTLFGSRARGDNDAKSDIDIAAEGCPDFLAFEEDVQENLWSLLKVDTVNLDEAVSDGLRADIQRDGKVLYEAL